MLNCQKLDQHQQILVVNIITQDAEAINERGVTIASSPFLFLNLKAKSKATEPFETAIEYFVPVNFENSCSKAFPSLPVQ